MADIIIRDFVKRFGDYVALKRLDLNIHSGEFFTLLGPSGCGKTTLLRTIAGFHRQDEGDLIISGQLANDVPPHQRDTGMVFQNYAIFPHMTVFDNVAYGLKHRGVRKAELGQRVAKALARVHLTGYEDRYPANLSGGQKQRVVLARALIIEPKVLLMDEPLSNLDAKLRVQMRRDIRLLQQDLGITTVYVTHDQEEALAVSDRILVMEEGMIRQIGNPRTVYADPAHLFVAGFIGSCNMLDSIFDRDGGTLRLGPAALTVSGLDLADGEQVVVCVRPEDVQLVTDTDPIPDIVLSARVKLASFLGSLVRVEAELEDSGTLLEIDLPGGFQGAVLETGTPIRLGFAASATRLFAKSDGRRLYPWS